MILLKLTQLSAFFLFFFENSPNKTLILLKLDSDIILNEVVPSQEIDAVPNLKCSKQVALVDLDEERNWRLIITRLGFQCATS